MPSTLPWARLFPWWFDRRLKKETQPGETVTEASWRHLARKKEEAPKNKTKQKQGKLLTLLLPPLQLSALLHFFFVVNQSNQLKPLNPRQLSGGPSRKPAEAVPESSSSTAFGAGAFAAKHSFWRRQTLSGGNRQAAARPVPAL